MPRRKRAVITGASHGVGRAVAEFLASKGWAIALVARNETNLRQVAASIKERTGHDPEVFSVDLTDKEQRGAIFPNDDNGSQTIDAIVHCASSTPDPDLHEALANTPEVDVDETISTIVEATTWLLKSFLSLDSVANRHYIQIGSDWGNTGSHGPSVFSASKAYIRHLAHTSRIEASKKGISISTIIPGDIASFDEAWEEPKWRFDDPIDAVRKELGDSRISLIDICESVEYCLSRKLARVEEIVLSPISSDYDY